MTDLRQAAQQALEALEELDGLDTETECVTIDVGDVMDALRSALEQQQAEPVSELQRRYLESEKAFQQQAEPVSMRMPKVGDKVICLEDESLGEVVSLTAGGSPDIAFDDGSRGTYMLGEFANLFSYVTPPQRQWQGLTDEEITELRLKNFDAVATNYESYRAIEAKLKERNNG